MRISTISVLGLASLLAACGGGGSSNNSGASGGGGSSTVPAIGSAAEGANGTYIVEQTSGTTTLPATNATFNGQPAWVSGPFRANAYNGTNVLALGGIDAGGAFSGITGTTTEAPTGNASYTGAFSVNGARGGTTSISGRLALDYDFAAQTLTNDGGDFIVDGRLNGDTIEGTVEYENDTGNFEGGFYGTNEVAGAFQGQTIGGVFFGTEN